MVLSSAVVLPDGRYVFVAGATRSDEKYSDMLRLKLTTDDKVIDFTSERDGNAEIYIMNADSFPFLP